MKKSIITSAIASVIAFHAIAQNNNIEMKNINDNAPVKCTKTITIQASAATVYSILTDINSWPGWQSDISAATLTGEPIPGNTFKWKTGGAKIQSEIHTAVKEKTFGWTGKTMGLRAIHNWSMREVKGAIELSVEESMEGWLAQLFKKSFNKNLESGMIKWLELLKKKSETIS